MPRHLSRVILQQVTRLVGGRSSSAATDTQLLEAFVATRNEDAFAVLVQRHGPMVAGVCRRSLRERTDVEDGFQATFLVLAHKAGTIRQGASLGSWLHGVALRVARKIRLRATRVARQTEPLIDVAGPEHADQVTWGELRTVLDDELNRLPVSLRTPLLLCYLDGRTQDEAARQLGWSKSTVRRRLERGRNLLRLRLERRGISLGAALCGPLLTDAATAGLVQTLMNATVSLVRNPAAAGRAATVATAILHRMALQRTLWNLILLLSFGLLTVGGMLAFAAVGHEEPPAEQPAAVAAQPAVDLHGDPLPPGALLRLGTVRFRHANHASGDSAFAFLPDNQTILTVDSTGTMHFRDVASGRLLRSVDSGSRKVSGSAVSPDGKYVVVAEWKDTGKDQLPLCRLRMVESETGKERWASFSIDYREFSPCKLAYAPDGSYVVAITGDRAIRIYDTKGGTETFCRRMQTTSRGNLTFSPDGSHFAVTGRYEVILWKWPIEREPREILTSDQENVIGFSPDGKLLAVAGTKKIHFLDVATRTFLPDETALPIEDSCSNLGFSLDGKLLAVTKGNPTPGGISLFDLTTRRLQRQLPAPGPWAVKVAFSPDRRWLVGSSSNCLHVFDLANNMEARTPGEAHESMLNDVAVTDEVIATGSNDGTVRLWDALTGRQRLVLPHRNQVQAVALRQDGRMVASTCLDDSVRLWNPTMGQELHRLPGNGQFGGTRWLAFTPDRKRLVSWGDDFYLQVWDSETGKALHKHDTCPDRKENLEPREQARERMRRFMDHRANALSPDGRLFLLGSVDKVIVYDVESGKPTRTITTAIPFLEKLTCSRDNRYLLASGHARGDRIELPNGLQQFVTNDEHPLALYDLNSGELIRTTQLPGRRNGAIAFSADGKLYAEASGSPQCRIRIWETATGKEQPGIGPFAGSVQALAFLPDGRRLVTTMDDTTALVWAIPERR